MSSFSTPAILAVAVMYFATTVALAKDGDGSQNSFLSGGSSSAFSRKRLLMHRKLLMEDTVNEATVDATRSVNAEESYTELSLQERLLKDKKKKKKNNKKIKKNGNNKKKKKNENKREKRNKKRGWDNWNYWSDRGVLDEWGNCICDEGQWWGRALFADEADELSTQSRDEKTNDHDYENDLEAISGNNEEQNEAATQAEMFATAKREDTSIMTQRKWKSGSKRNRGKKNSTRRCSCRHRRPLFPPTYEPTYEPTFMPTEKPTRRPTLPPTKKPTKSPKPTRTPKPTKSPTKPPSPAPSPQPTPRPTRNPSGVPPPTPRPTRNPASPPITPFPTRNPASPPRSPFPTRNPASPPSTPRPTFYVCLENTFCRGVRACEGVPDLNLINQNGACNGFEACRNVGNTISFCSCIGSQSCLNNVGNIGNDSW